MSAYFKMKTHIILLTRIIGGWEVREIEQYHYTTKLAIKIVGYLLRKKNENERIHHSLAK